MIDQIERSDILTAAASLSSTGIDDASLFNNYYVETEHGEFPFLQLVRLALGNKLERKITKKEIKASRQNREAIETLGFGINYYKEHINFFAAKELNDYAAVAGKPYRRAIQEDVRFGNLIKPLVRKVNKWAELSVVDDFEYKADNHWQWSGTFKTYLWVRIYKKRATDKAFFVFGVGKNGNLYIQLNCLWSNHTAGTTEVLQGEVVHEVQAYLSASNYQAKSIDIASLESYDWDMLVEESSNYILEHSALYDEISAIVMELERSTVQDESTGNPKLTIEDAPTKIRSRAEKTIKKTVFTGKKVDWVKKQESSIKLGNKGEQLVILSEQERLRQLKKPDLADQVKKVLDGEGYDILSFEENGDERYIEVKTTVNSKEEPFQITLNEYVFSRLNREQYFIYRLFEFKVVAGAARCFVLGGEELDNVHFEPIAFEVSLK